ncbi:MnhB domain-containing protein [Halocatena marina]|uniref:MnhB domain-containing protein n=1 Tax=Halocatena marina TaxID=2934937 RepID=A0ABD5YTD5_9EURY|nr:MnhB domain-containing protein [Halocatena marina]
MTTQPTIIARTVVRTVVPIILLTAIALVLQGHNLPGGGFIGGVLTATAFALVYISYGSEYLVQALLSGAEGAEGTGAETESIQAESRFLSGAIGTYTRMFAFGLALAAGSGVVAVVLGVPFLTQAVALVHHVPIYKELEFASALAFDLGVYFVVVGSLLTILAVVGDE